MFFKCVTEIEWLYSFSISWKQLKHAILWLSSDCNENLYNINKKVANN